MSITASGHGTATRFLRFVRPAAEAPTRTFTQQYLMDESERRLCIAAHCGAPVEELIATRVLDNVKDFHRWEDEHAVIMRRIAIEHRSDSQRSALLSASLALIQRKALFEYLRDRKVRGDDRRRLMAVFFNQRDYESAVIHEHGNYLRSAASYLCSSHVGRHLLLDDIFDEPLTMYEDLYTDYFRAYCDSVLKPSDDPVCSFALPLALHLKRQVNEWRCKLQSLAISRSGALRRQSLPTARLS